MSTPHKKFYKSADGEILAFFCHPDGNRMKEVVFAGSDETILSGQMESFWNRESERAKRFFGKPETESEPTMTPDAKPEPTRVATEGRGLAFAGSKWMADKTGKRTRVPPNEVEKRLAEGWVFKGPRG